MDVRAVKVLPELLLHHAESRPDAPFLYRKQGDRYQAQSYRTILSEALSFARCLGERGVKAGDRLAIMSNNRPEWVITDIGAMLAGVITVPIYPTLSAEELKVICDDAKPTMIIVENADMLEKLSQIHSDCDYIKQVVSIGAGAGPDMQNLCGFRECLLPESKAPEDTLALAKSYVAKRDASEVVSIVYTSGTTGVPKGVQLTHENILCNVRDIVGIFQIDETDSVLSILPLSHVFERTVGYYCVLAFGARIYYAESNDSVAADLLLARPTVLIAVPRFFEKIRARIMGQLRGLRRVLFYWAMRVYGRASKTGGYGVQAKLAERLVIKKVKAKTGGRIRFFVSGGAALNPVDHQFFESLGFPVVEGYGLTEAAPIIACNTVDKRVAGSVGRGLPSQELKISEEGELLTKGDNVSIGYYQNADATDAVMTKDGFLRTGDVATIDDEGNVRIVDRLKELIVMSNGKKVAPLMIEERLKADAAIEQIVVVGEKRNYMTALIVPNWEHVSRVLNVKLLASDDDCERTDLMKLLSDIIEKNTDDLSRYEKIKRFKVLPNEFTQEGGELTPTLKIKRRVIREKYKAQIDAMYAEKEAKGASKKEG